MSAPTMLAESRPLARAPSTMLEQVRAAEWEDVKHLFRPGMRVLDLGGGSGYQASLMSEYGCEVVSIDICRRPPETMHFPVAIYDGLHIPATDGSFDAVFSSNVLEHIRSLPPILRELERVLRADGFALHIMPSATWRVWTTVTAFVYLFQRATGLRPAPSAQGIRETQEMASLNGPLASWWRRVGQAFAPHGEYANALVEVYYFSRRRWIRVFESNGWAVVGTARGGIYYSGYMALPSQNIARRKRLARVLGSSATIFVTRPGGMR
jgi:SAM-dependent methyltransferase